MICMYLQVETSIVFFCQGCGAMFFAAVNEPKVLKDHQKDIARLLAQGHRMKEVPHHVVRQQFNRCICNDKRVDDRQIALDLGI